MDTILIASTDDSAVSTIRQGLGDDYTIETARDRESCLSRFREQQSGILFIDLALLAPPGQPACKVDYTEAFQIFRQIFPLSQIVVMSRQNNIRELVRAVKSGAIPDTLIEC